MMLPVLDADMEHSSLASTTVGSRPLPDLKCCCGKMECAYLKHNNAALEGLEKEVRTAAQIGQVRFASASRLHFATVVSGRGALYFVQVRSCITVLILQVCHCGQQALSKRACR